MEHRELFPGNFIHFAGGDDSPHWFGGTHQCKGAWCANCGLPLLLYLTVDVSDVSEQLATVPCHRLCLFYCMRCSLCWYDFSYRILNDEEIEILEEFRGDTTWEDWYSEGLSDSFARRGVQLQRIPARLQELYNRLNNNDELSPEEEAEIASFTGQYANPEVGSYPIVDVINQLGGRSFLCQRLDDPVCPGCRRIGLKPQRMYFLASLTNDPKENLKMTFDGVQIVFFICKQCSTIKVRHSI